jgi:hypothetical protein
MATRYKGKIAYWTIWNEPNLAYSFSPQDLNLGSGYLTNEYMDLVQIPAHGAITTVIPGALTVGPDLYTPNGGGQVETCDYYNHCMWLYGTGEWEDAMLRYFDSYFPTFSIHNNSDTDVGANAAVGNTWNLVMVPLGKQRNIWLSEYNFGNNGTCSNSEQTLANYTRNLYTNMGNQRDFYFSLTDGWGTPACGDGIVWGQGYNWAEKSVLYPAFTNIVGTT